MTKHGPRSPRWHGHPRAYQSEAQHRYAIEHQRSILPWSLVRTTCETPMCLDVECMILLAPEKIDYPRGSCVYCGEPAGSRDHLLPAPMTGETLRQSVLTVPSCSDCNNRINDFPSYCVTERRERVRQSLRKNNKILLNAPDKTPADLRQLGPTLRSVAVKNNIKRARLRARLSWPDDPFYDLRAFQRSGIEDPVALGLVAGIDRQGEGAA